MPCSINIGCRSRDTCCSRFDLRVAEAGVTAHERLQSAFLLFLGPLAEQHHPHHVEEGHADQVLDVDAAVAEQADVALHIRYGSFPDDDASQVSWNKWILLEDITAPSKIGNFSQYRPGNYQSVELIILIRVLEELICVWKIVNCGRSVR